MMKKISTFILCSLFSVCLLAQAEGPLVATNYPLNEASKADAYSWLSQDGLRVYFSRGNSAGEIWKAERKNLSEAFSNPSTVSIDGIKGDDDVFSCWLTVDEKTIFFTTHEDGYGFSTFLYKATYDENSKSFMNAEKLNLTGGEISERSSIFISAPSLTADLNQLFVYYNDEHSDDRLACFTTTDGINYVFKSFVNDALNYCPGSLANNGLSFYLTLRGEDNTLVKLSRPNLNAEFGNPEYFKIDPSINVGKQYYQPSANTELGIISLTFGLGTWESNDLAIIKIPDTKTVVGAPELASDIISEDKFPDQIEMAEEADVAEELSINEGLYIQSADAPVHCDIPPSLSIDETIQNWVVIDDTLLNVDIEFAIDDTLSFDSPDDLITPISKGYKESMIFEAMPNPAATSFKIIYKLKTSGDEKPVFELTNLNGQVIKHFELASSQGNVDIDINGLAEGMYFYRILTSGESSPIKKLIVKR